MIVSEPPRVTKTTLVVFAVLVIILICTMVPIAYTVYEKPAMSGSECKMSHADGEAHNACCGFEGADAGGGG